MPPPPRVEIRLPAGLSFTDYYEPESPWLEGGFCWLHCHRGEMWLFTPAQHIAGPWCFSFFCIVTRGPWKDAEERIELFFPSGLPPDRTTITLRPWQCNRLPGWQPGKRCWKLHVVTFNGRAPHRYSVLFWRTVFWRQAPLPCLQPWEGPRPDGRFSREPHPVRTAEEERAYWDGLHQLNGTYDRKKPKRLADNWVDILYRRFGRHNEEGSADVPY